MDDLVQFLTARLDEDEWKAQAAKDAAAKRTHYRASMLASTDRELRDIEAKRRVIALWQEADQQALADQRYAESHDTGVSGYTAGREAALEDALRLLALPYADHPDYREAWRP